MKNANSRNVLHKVLLLALILGLGATIDQPSFAKLSKTQKFESIDEDAGDTLASDEVEEEVIVKPAPRKVKRRIVREEEQESSDEVVPVVAPVAASQSNAQAAAQDNSAGSRIGKMIDTKLDHNRRIHEEEMRRKQKEDEEKLIGRIGGALDEPAPAPAPAPQQQQLAPVAAPAPVAAAKTYRTDDAEEVEMEGSSKSKSASGLGQSVSLAPRVGASWLKNDTYNIDTGTTMGFDLLFNLDDNIAIEGGYSYAKYNISLAQNSFAYNGFSNYYPQFGGPNSNNLNSNLNKLEYAQNVIDVGVRYTMFDRDSVVRPYIGMGGGYMKGYLNYSQQAINLYRQNPANLNNGSLQDYEVTGWTGFLQLGTLLNFSKNFGIGADYRYHKVLSSNENAPLYNYTFLNSVPNQQAIAPATKDFVRGTLQDSDFQTVNLTLNLTF